MLEIIGMFAVWALGTWLAAAVTALVVIRLTPGDGLASMVLAMWGAIAVVVLSVAGALIQVGRMLS